MTVNFKKKGNLWENKLANWLRDHGYKAWKDGASGGGSREKGDVGNNLDMTIESKACKKVELMKWWKQVSKSADMQKNAPVLFIHQDGMGDNEWLTVLHSEDFMDLLKGDSLPEQDYTPEEDRNKKWQLEKTLTEIKKLIKMFD